MFVCICVYVCMGEFNSVCEKEQNLPGLKVLAFWISSVPLLKKCEYELIRLERSCSLDEFNSIVELG